MRAARQQDFLRQAKEQVGVGRIVATARSSAKIFGSYTESDIDSARRACCACWLVVALGAAARSARCTSRARSAPSYVTASQQPVDKMAERVPGHRGTRRARAGARSSADATPSEPQAAARKEAPHGRRRRGRRAGPGAAGRDRAGSRDSGLLPARKRPARRCSPAPPRVYNIKRRRQARTGRTAWSSGTRHGRRVLRPPGHHLEGPADPRGRRPRRKKIGGAVRGHYDGDRVRLVAWRTGDGVYWVSNTLLQTPVRAQKQMLAPIARHQARAPRGLAERWHRPA